MSTHAKKLLLIDAHAIIHRAFHALPPLTATDGTQVNALYGFLLILIKALKDIKPEYVAVAFDSKGKTFRHEQFPEYKAHRPPAPDELKSQFPLVREMVEAFGLPMLAVPLYEADDIIGTICAQLENTKGLETIIVTGDLDLLQLVDNNTRVMKLQKGVKDTLIYDEAVIKQKYGLTPRQVIDYKGLRGDASDNIPGVRGIGEKSALSLLQQYHTIEGVYEHIDELPGRMKKCLDGEAQKKIALLSRKLATIAHDAPVEFSLERAAIGAYDKEKIIRLFRAYEFKSLLPQLSTLPKFEPEQPKMKQQGLFATAGEGESQGDTATSVGAGAKRNTDELYHLVEKPEDVRALAKRLSEVALFAFDTETQGLRPTVDALVGMSFCWKAGEAFYLPCRDGVVPPEIKKIMENARIKKTGHNTKFDIEVMHRAGVQVSGIAFDTMIASYLLNASSRSHGLDYLAFIEYGYRMQPIEELIGKGKDQISMADVPIEKVSWYACEDADFAWRLYEKYAHMLERQGLQKLMDEMELPTVHALVLMEEAGVKIDVDFLQKMSVQLHRRLRALEKQIHKLAGFEFNVASSVQLKDVLFKTLNISTHKIAKIKTGFSTAASELEKMRDKHPMIPLIQEHRELSKLTSTYIDSLPQLIYPETGRIHTSFNQTVAATGRLSSSDPNLQNIPVRTELGKSIRKAFVPEAGNVLLSLDYSQIELRIVAHLAQDPVMMKAFKHGEDIHVRTAAELAEVALRDVTPEMRRKAKAINFGILYGMGVSGIMRDSGISRIEAQTFLDKYFEVHEGIKTYLESVKTFTVKNGYAETLFGRRRPLPEIRSTNQMMRAAAERAAVNMPVQGTSADIMKLAMIAVHDAIEDGRVDALMILQVHDELVFEVREDRVRSEARKLRKIMEQVYALRVPLVVSVEAGKNWGELGDVL